MHCFTVTPCGCTRLIVWVCLPHVKASQEQSNRKMKLLYFYTDIISSLSFLPLKDMKNLQGNRVQGTWAKWWRTHGPTNRRGLSKQERRRVQQVPAESRDRRVPGDMEASSGGLVGKAIVDIASAPEVIPAVLRGWERKQHSWEEAKREGEQETMVWKDEGLICALSKHSCGGAVDKRLRVF